MNQNIYLRPLQIEDAHTSYKWRNDPQVWTYTAFVPTNKITKDIELKWLDDVLKRENEKRYAVCVSRTNEYIGNVQLINIENNIGEFTIFIGEKKYWGKGIGHEATKQMLELAFTELNFSSVYLYVHPDNITAIRCYQRAGFKFSSQSKFIKMEATQSSLYQAIE